MGIYSTLLPLRLLPPGFHISSQTSTSNSIVRRSVDMQYYTQYHNQSMPQAAQTIDTQSLDWNAFHQEMFPVHRLSLPDTLLPENMLFSPYSPHSAIPLNPGCQNLLLPHASTHSTVSMPSSPVSGISEPYSSKKDSQAYIRRRYQNRAAQRAFRARQKDHMEALEQKLQSMLSEYDDLQRKYTSLSLAYETLVNEKAPQENDEWNSWDFSDPGNQKKEEERLGILEGSFRNR